MAKSKKADAPMTDRELTRRLFSKSVRKQLNAAEKHERAVQFFKRY